MKAYAKSFLAMLVVSTLGFWVLIFLVPDSGPLSLWERTLWLAGCTMTLPTWPLFLHDPLAGPLQPYWLAAYIMVSALVWPLLLLAAKRLWKRITEPAASPNGVPAQPVADSGVDGGPPSVS